VHIFNSVVGVPIFKAAGKGMLKIKPKIIGVDLDRPGWL
jgi:hypothetical protein